MRSIFDSHAGVLIYAETGISSQEMYLLAKQLCVCRSVMFVCVQRRGIVCGIFALLPSLCTTSANSVLFISVAKEEIKSTPLPNSSSPTGFILANIKKKRIQVKRYVYTLECSGGLSRGPSRFYKSLSLLMKA